MNRSGPEKPPNPEDLIDQEFLRENVSTSAPSSTEEQPIGRNVEPEDVMSILNEIRKSTVAQSETAEAIGLMVGDALGIKIVGQKEASEEENGFHEIRKTQNHFTRLKRAIKRNTYSEDAYEIELVKEAPNFVNLIIEPEAMKQADRLPINTVGFELVSRFLIHGDALDIGTYQRLSGVIESQKITPIKPSKDGQNSGKLYETASGQKLGPFKSSDENIPEELTRQIKEYWGLSANERNYYKNVLKINKIIKTPSVGHIFFRYFWNKKIFIKDDLWDPAKAKIKNKLKKKPFTEEELNISKEVNKWWSQSDLRLKASKSDIESDDYILNTAKKYARKRLGLEKKVKKILKRQHRN